MLLFSNGFWARKVFHSTRWIKYSPLYTSDSAFAVPFRVAADPPFAERFPGAAELAVGGGVEIVGHGPNGQRAAELLVSRFIPGNAEFGFPQRSLQRREQVRDGLRIVPDVRTRA